jgi:hypothetical protein
MSSINYSKILIVFTNLLWGWCSRGFRGCCRGRCFGRCYADSGVGVGVAASSWVGNAVSDYLLILLPGEDDSFSCYYSAA